MSYASQSIRVETIVSTIYPFNDHLSKNISEYKQKEYNEGRSVTHGHSQLASDIYYKEVDNDFLWMNHHFVVVEQRVDARHSLMTSSVNFTHSGNAVQEQKIQTQISFVPLPALISGEASQEAIRDYLIVAGHYSYCTSLGEINSFHGPIGMKSSHATHGSTGVASSSESSGTTAGAVSVSIDPFVSETSGDFSVLDLLAGKSDEAPLDRFLDDTTDFDLFA